MRDETNDHFFACNLLWWALRVTFCRLELVQGQGLPDRVDACTVRLEEVNLWLMDELVKAGADYIYEGQRTPLVSLDRAPIETRLTELVRSLEALAASAAPAGVAQGDLIYHAVCGWVAALLRALTELEGALSSTEPSAAYAKIKDEVVHVIHWFEAQRAGIARTLIPSARLDALAPAIAFSARAWREMVLVYSERYPRSVG